MIYQVQLSIVDYQQKWCKNEYNEEKLLEEIK